MAVSAVYVLLAVCLCAAPTPALRQSAPAARNIVDSASAADLQDNFWEAMGSEVEGAASMDTSTALTPMLMQDGSQDPMMQVENWVHCADEGQDCTCSGQVRYGAADKWNAQSVSKGIQCSSGAMGPDPIAGYQKTCECQASVVDPKQDWAHCADEGQDCKCSGEVRYGAADKWIAQSVSMSIQCNSDAMGPDPLVGYRKSCECQASVGPTPAPLVREARTRVEDEVESAPDAQPVSYHHLPGMRQEDGISSTTQDEVETAPDAQAVSSATAAGREELRFDTLGKAVQDDLQSATQSQPRPPPGLDPLDQVQRRIDRAKEEFETIRKHHHRHVARVADRTHTAVSHATGSVAKRLEGMRRENAVLRRALRQRDQMQNIVQANALEASREEQKGLTGTYVAIVAAFDLLMVIGLFMNHRYVKSQPLDSEPSGAAGGAFLKFGILVDENMHEIVCIVLLIEVGLLLVRGDAFGEGDWSFIGEAFTIGVVCAFAYIVHVYFQRQASAGGRAISSQVGEGKDVYARFGSPENTQAVPPLQIQKGDKSGMCC